MGYELLSWLTALLNEAGLRAGEEYPAGKRVEILSPVAAVGLRELDMDAGEVRFSVRVLSPGLLGGWCCQTWAAKAVQVLHGAGLTTATGEMAYLKSEDCFCISITASLAAVPGEAGWTVGRRWRVLCGDSEAAGVVSFRAERALGRSFVGEMGCAAPQAVTEGAGGWLLELRLRDADVPETEEPFVLTASCADFTHRYTGCCWNEAEYEYGQGGLTVTRRVLALGKEESDG